MHKRLIKLNKIKMKKLLNQLQNKYIDYIKNLNFLDNTLKEKIIKILSTKNQNERSKLWNNLLVKLENLKEIHSFSNPYYIGFGNPNSDILFLGKEKGFDIENRPDLFFLESIDNIKQWELLTAKKNFNAQDSLYEKLNFNPIFPRLKHTQKISKRHTWGMYAHIISELKNLNHDTLINEVENYSNSLFNYCFMSEINYIPSKYSKGAKLSPLRKEFLSNEFYKKFPLVIIGAKNCLKAIDICDVFDAELSETNKEVGQNKARKIRIDIFKSNNQKIILCDHLSGAAGWTNDAISNLVVELK